MRWRSSGTGSASERSTTAEPSEPPGRLATRTGALPEPGLVVSRPDLGEGCGIAWSLRQTMATNDDRRNPDCGGEAAALVWRRLRNVLEEGRARLQEEIERYPQPIPACDEQFNHLLEERARTCRGLARVDAGARVTLTTCRSLLDELVTSSSLISSDLEKELRSRLRDGDESCLPVDS